MTGNRALLDSNIVIYLSKHEIPLEFIDQYDELFISVITFMEILGYPFSEPKKEALLKNCCQFLKRYMWMSE